MPPKQKPKKGVLEDTQIQTTVQIVKHYWPDYAISAKDIRNPTREFILKFYTQCVNNLDEKCAFVTRSNLISYPPGVGEEELLFLKLSRIPSLVDADFKLGDLFIYDPKTVNTHIFVTMQFLIFTETMMDKMMQICNNVFDTKEEIHNNEEVLKQLKEEKTQKQINTTLAKAENIKLKEAAGIIAPKYEETLLFLEESEKKCKDSILEADRLKSQMENIQEEIDKLENTELHLKSQIVTQEEYKDLKSSLQSLLKEEENLEEIDMSNGLLEQKQHIEQLQMCLQELNQLHLPKDIFELSDLRVQLKNEQQSLEYALAFQQNSKAEFEQLNIQLEKQKNTVQTENENLQITLKQLMENGMMAETTLKKKYQLGDNTNISQVQELKRTVEQKEADLTGLKNDLLHKYKAICKMQDMAMERFQRFLSRVKNKLENDINVSIDYSYNKL